LAVSFFPATQRVLFFLETGGCTAAVESELLVVRPGPAQEEEDEKLEEEEGF